ncbi:MAG: response regulator transcription factor [Deltaproteobacteria bacterium]|nr:response regulator transcription factor [Deltaproteobacteria bacterium]MCB9786359.1 response regulator transcription factor [Deltaproteobacteria bacterium]
MERATSLPRRILLVDDHPIVRQGLAELVRRRTEHKICGEASDPASALDWVRRTSPDLVIVDISLGNSSGLDLLKQLGVEFPEVKTLVVSMRDEHLYGERAIAAGARGYVMKDQAAEHIGAAIDQVLAGRMYTSAALTERLLQRVTGRSQAPASPLECLSDRELQVFECIGHGSSTREIAASLHLSVKTIEGYRANIKEKLGLATGTELVQRAVLWVEAS